MKRCPACRHILTPGDPPWCQPCNTATSYEHDARGRLQRSWNARGQIVFMARASHRLHDTEPHRAMSGYSNPLDGWTPTGVARIAQLKPRP